MSKLNLSAYKKEYSNLKGVESNITKIFDIVKFTIHTLEGDIYISAVVVDTLPTVNIQGIEIIATELRNKNFILADTMLNNSNIDNVDILIGNDLYYEFVKTTETPINIDGVWLMPTKFGYCITGNLPVSNNISVNSLTILNICVQSFPWKDTLVADINSEVDKLWLIDNIGITGDMNENLDTLVLNKFNDY